MCVPCVLQVSRAFTFKQQCQRSDQTLRLYLGQIDKVDTENADFRADFKNIESDGTSDVSDVHRNVIKVEKPTANQFNAIDDTTTDHLNSQLDLDSLPAEIESNSFEGDIELSNLPDSVADDEIQQHLDACTKTEKSIVPPKYGDYFDEIKLDVDNVVPLTDSELPDQSIVGTFGKHEHSTCFDQIEK